MSVAKFKEELQTLNHSLNFPQTIFYHAKCKDGNKYMILEFQTANSAFVKGSGTWMIISEFQNFSVEVNIELDIQKALTIHFTAMTAETAGTKKQTRLNSICSLLRASQDILPLKKSSYPHLGRQTHLGIISKPIWNCLIYFFFYKETSILGR